MSQFFPLGGQSIGATLCSTTEDEMVEWHHQLVGHVSEQTPGDSEGQGSLECCPWGCKESDTTLQLNNSK